MGARAEHLHVVDSSTGEVQDLCQNPACIAAREELRGVTAEKRSWRAKYYRAIEDKEAKAKASELWPAAIALFDTWKLFTGHKRSKWTADRFWVIERYLREEGPQECRYALYGLLGSDFHMKRGKYAKRDGQVFDEFERPFGSQAEFEKFNRAGRPVNADFWTWVDSLP